MRKFIAIILGLALICGLVITTGNPTITRADKEESPVVFANDNSSVTIYTQYSGSAVENVYVFTEEEKALLDEWGEYNYTCFSPQDFRTNVGTVFDYIETSVVIYSTDAELRIDPVVLGSQIYMYGNVFEKDTSTPVKYILVPIQDNTLDGNLDGSSDNTHPSINDDITSIFRAYPADLGIDAAKETIASTMYSTATVRTYNKDTLEIGDIMYEPDILNVSDGPDVEVQGSESQSKVIRVTANIIQSVYSVSLPASIDLSYGIVEDETGGDVEGYWYNLKYGVSGKLTSDEKVYVNVTYPCTLTDGATGATISLTELHSGCKTTWTVNEVGSCTYDGITLSNCQYAYCCTDGHVIGVRAEDVSTKGTYEGNLTFTFGISSN